MSSWLDAKDASNVTMLPWLMAKAIRATKASLIPYHLASFHFQQNYWTLIICRFAVWSLNNLILLAPGSYLWLCNMINILQWPSHEKVRASAIHEGEPDSLRAIAMTRLAFCSPIVAIFPLKIALTFQHNMGPHRCNPECLCSFPWHFYAAATPISL